MPMHNMNGINCSSFDDMLNLPTKFVALVWAIVTYSFYESVNISQLFHQDPSPFLFCICLHLYQIYIFRNNNIDIRHFCTSCQYPIAPKRIHRNYLLRKVGKDEEVSYLFCSSSLSNISQLLGILCLKNYIKNVISYYRRTEPFTPAPPLAGCQPLDSRLLVHFEPSNGQPCYQSSRTIPSMSFTLSQCEPSWSSVCSNFMRHPIVLGRLSFATDIYFFI